MFSPLDRELERGWPGRIEGDEVVQLAAQTLQAFLAGGGEAREHAVYQLAEVVLRPPVLHPPSVRIFDGEDFRFANPAAVIAGGGEPAMPSGPRGTVSKLVPVRRQAAIIGGDGWIGGFTEFVEWTAPELRGEKSRDFALGLGPVVTTRDEGVPGELEIADWERIVSLMSHNTRLYPGDVIAA